MDTRSSRKLAMLVVALCVSAHAPARASIVTQDGFPAAGLRSGLESPRADRPAALPALEGIRDRESRLMTVAGKRDGVPDIGWAHLSSASAGDVSEAGMPAYPTAALHLSVAGDYNDSGLVEQGDLDLVLLNWGNDAGDAPAEWANERPVDRIDQEELDRVLLNWGNSAGISAMPEATGASVGLLRLASVACAHLVAGTARHFAA